MGKKAAQAADNKNGQCHVSEMDVVSWLRHFLRPQLAANVMDVKASNVTVGSRQISR
jgi:hypothetical protein